jgi:hypothetical protein
MRRQVEHYQGYEVNQDVINKINIIAFKRYSEGRYGLLHEDYLDFNDLCYRNTSVPEDTYITLGEDWFIIYTKDTTFMELIEWVSIDHTKNKFIQTIEMFNEIKQILLSSYGQKICSLMKHNTSYKFYYELLIRGYLCEHNNNITMDLFLPSDINKTACTICQSYEHLSNFFKDENRDKLQEEILEDYIYHDVEFTITDKFVKRYKK